MSASIAVGIVAKPGSEPAHELARRLASRLTDHASVTFDERTADVLDRAGQPAESLDRCDLVVALGGDGTLLHVVSAVGSTPVVGVDLGEVGLLASVEPADAPEIIARLVHDCRDGTLETTARNRVVAAGDDWTLGPALNEILVQGPRRGPAGGVELTVDFDGARYTRTVAEGVLVATPTGSTAYTLSEGGPIVHPAITALLVTVMSDRAGGPPLVLDDSTSVSITVDGPDTAVAIADGTERRALDTPETITFGVAAEPARLAGSGEPFAESLRSLRRTS